MSSDFEIPKDKVQEKAGRARTLPKNVPEPVAETPEQEAPAKPKYEKIELTRIFDDLIFTGMYTEIVDIRGKLKVGFRTRTSDEVEKITFEIDQTPAKLMATLVEKRAVLNLYYALQSYGGNDLSSQKIEEKIKFVKSLPAPIVGALIGALAAFDDKVYAATKEGEENF